jgi:tetratricopeptide (TPR) repeat protein
MIRLLALVLCLALSGLQAPAAPACPADASDPAGILKVAIAAWSDGRLDAADACFAAAAERAAGEGATPVEAEASLGLARVALRRGQAEAGEARAARALELFESGGDAVGMAYSRTALGAAAFAKGDRAQARTYYEEAARGFTEAGLERERVEVSLDLLYTVPPGEEYDRLLAEALGSALANGFRRAEGRALHQRSDGHFGAGRFDDAIGDLLKAIEALEDAGAPRDLANANVSLGRILRAHGRPADALQYYDRAIALQNELGEFRSHVQSLNAKAIALEHLGRLADARATYEQALAIAQRAGARELIDFVLGNLASVHANAGDYRRAIAILEDVLTREKNPYMLAYRHGSLAANALALGDLPLAQRHIGLAVEYGRTSNNREYLPVLLYRAARINRDAGRPDEALARASEAIEVLEDLRGRLVPLDYLKRGFSDRWQTLFGLTLGLLHARGEHERAVATAELARARAFLDLLASRDLADRDPGLRGGFVDL